MQRRKFLTSSLTASALAATAPVGYLQGTPQAVSSDGKGREFYQLRCYHLSSGPQRKLCDDFFREALLPALNRLAIAPVGVLDLAIGPETPSIYVLMPSLSLETLVNVETRLAEDAEYMKVGAPFLNAPATAPALRRMESSLLQAFQRTPRLKLPPATATNAPRVFELRTYESPSDQDHKRKIEMMDTAEGAIFEKAGFFQVFYGDTLVGSRLPNLTYMISCESMAERDKKWAAFRNSPEWKNLSAQPRYASEAIVSNITNVILTPTAYSQI
jgi:hypothetical protein